MPELKATGKIIRIGDTRSVSSTFQKREVVIETEGQYPQTVPFEVVQDKCDLVDNFSINDQVEVYFNLRGSYYQKKDKYFVQLNAWRIDFIES